MDSMLFILIVFVTVATIGGAWGWVLLSGWMKRRTIKLESATEDPRVGEILESHQLLEARVEQLEEEISFFRELHRPESLPQLPEGGEEKT